MSFHLLDNNRIYSISKDPVLLSEHHELLIEHPEELTNDPVPLVRSDGTIIEKYEQPVAKSEFMGRESNIKKPVKIIGILSEGIGTGVDYHQATVDTEAVTVQM